MQKFSAVPGVFAGFVMLLAPAVSFAGISFSITIAPPVLEVYEQPPCPTDGYLWTPGYWGYRGSAYYWIPGAWVLPPQPGLLWTPGYWGYSGGLYGFNAGYWGPTVGFYGGVNYGFGYGGSGFDGGRWQGGHFAYNTAVSRVNTTVIHNTYNQTVTNRGGSRTSFNGGPGGIAARPSAAEASIARAHNQPSAAPATQQRASGATPVAHEQARPANTAATRPTAASDRSRDNRPAANAPIAAQPRQNARTEQHPTQVSSNRNTAPSRPAPAARPEQTHAAPAARPEQTHAAPQARPEQTHAAPAERPQQAHAAAPQARPQQAHAAAPERAAARPQGKEERK